MASPLRRAQTTWTWIHRSSICMLGGFRTHWPVCLMARWETRNSSLDVEYLQKSHLKGRSLVWDNWWLSSSFLFSQVYSQNSHLNLMQMKENTTKTLKYWRMKVQDTETKMLSPDLLSPRLWMWVSRCILNVYRFLKDLPHWKNIAASLPSEHVTYMDNTVSIWQEN